MRLVAASAAALVLMLIVKLSGAAQVGIHPHDDGQQIFRYDTFGDEQLWTDALRLHEVIGSVTPAVALNVAGLKVDVDALPPPVIKALIAGQVNLNDPRVTRRLLEMDAVVGVMAEVSADRIRSIGITCALCHSTVDDSLAPGIGHRLDGWPNLDLDVGLIVSLSPAPAIDPLRSELLQWGRGKYDPRHQIFDGTNIVTRFTPTLPVVIPPAYGLAGVGFETFTGDGPISYWNAYVGVTQMGGQGRFIDDRIGLQIIQHPDRVTAKLPALLAYQLGLPAPPPPAGSFDAVAAAQGELLFNGAAGCATCHIPPTYTDVASGPDPSVPLLHTAAQIGATSGYEDRSATGMFRTTPLRALWQHAPYFHDGRATNLLAVVNHYNQLFGLNLDPTQIANLVEFLKSL
jgi:hypothetical protein